jgi:hypothetical protein
VAFWTETADRVVPVVVVEDVPPPPVLTTFASSAGPNIWTTPADFPHRLQPNWCTATGTIFPPASKANATVFDMAALRDTVNSGGHR